MMENQTLYPVINASEVVLFTVFILIILIALVFFALVYSRLQNPKRCQCPYTRRAMWLGESVPMTEVKKVMRFLYYDIHNFENRVFPMKEAMICRDTGRIFPGYASWWGYSQIGWDFLYRRHPGIWVSWGSLSREQQQEITERHQSLEGFQTEHSSPNPAPRAIDEAYIYAKPGPLYVDLETYTLLGWKCVPETKFEVLIVQKPVRKGIVI